jgi:hypothetical protein
MPLFAFYLLKLSISLAVVWLFYQLVLRRLTFYGWNRWYLMGYTALCFFIPLIDIQRVVEGGPITAPAIIRYIPVFHPPVRDHSWDLVIFLVAAGSAILLIRLLFGWLSVRRIRGRARLIGDRVIDGAEGLDRMRVYQVDDQIVPFSFGNAIYINQALHTEKEYEEIILHEYVHIRQRHSVDILLAELLCALCWYNPFAWLIHHSIRQNLEFIADGKVLEKGFDRKGYQYHLLKVIGEPKYRLATNFNFSSLKKRIVMMNKIRSARLHLVKFLFILPLLAVLLVAFRKTNATVEKGKIGIKDTIPGNEATRGTRLKNVIEITYTKADGTKDSLPFIAESSGNHNSFIGVRDSVPKITESAGASGGSMTIGPTSNGPALYLVDGVETLKAEVMSLSPESIYSINVLKGKDAELYGEKGRNGVILITTKAARPRADTAGSPGPGQLNISVDSSRWVIKNSRPEGSMTMQGGNFSSSVGVPNPQPASLIVADSFKGLILLDGKEISNSELKSLNPIKIKRYDILSGDAAVKEYGERARQGVIAVISK